MLQRESFLPFCFLANGCIVIHKYGIIDSTRIEPWPGPWAPSQMHPYGRMMGSILRLLYYCAWRTGYDYELYSLMSNRGRSQNFQNLNFLHNFCDLLQEAHFPKGIRLKSFQYEMRPIFTRKSRTRDFMQHSSQWEQWNTHYYA